MSRSAPADPYRALLDQFNRRGVRYVVVGMTGINFYATNPAETFGTMDYDVLLDATMSNITKALTALRSLRWSVGTSDGPLADQPLAALVRDRRTLVATTPEGLMVELLLRVSGYAFSALAEDARTFTVHGMPIRVGQLEKLLKSKHAAGREKDRQFLRRYRLTLTTPRADTSARRFARRRPR